MLQDLNPHTGYSSPIKSVFVIQDDDDQMNLNNEEEKKEDEFGFSFLTYFNDLKDFSRKEIHAASKS